MQPKQTPINLLLVYIIIHYAFLPFPFIAHPSLNKLTQPLPLIFWISKELQPWFHQRLDHYSLQNEAHSSLYLKPFSFLLARMAHLRLSWHTHIHSLSFSALFYALGGWLTWVPLAPASCWIWLREDTSKKSKYFLFMLTGPKCHVWLWLWLCPYSSYLAPLFHGFSFAWVLISLFPC